MASRQESIDQMLEAIASTEQGLANIIKGEAGKITAAIEIHKETEPDSLDDLLNVNKSVESMMRKVIMKEMLLNFQLEDVVSLGNGDDPVPEYPDNISLRCFASPVPVGETVCYTAYLHPANVQNPIVTWHSTNPDVATVDGDGCVTALSIGMTVIVARTANNLEARCEFMVGTLPINFEISPDDFQIEPGQFQTITATVLPDTAVNIITWESADPSIAIVAQDGTVTGVNYGLTTIRATTINGLTATATVQVVQPPD